MPKNVSATHTCRRGVRFRRSGRSVCLPILPSCAALTPLESSQNAKKRKAEIVELTAEMECCIPDPGKAQELEGAEIGRLLSGFLKGLSKESRLIFLRRYWYAESILEIARRYGISESKVKTNLFRTRNKLRAYLESEGMTL